MTIMMTSKNQITIPKKLVKALNISEGALFDIHLKGNRLEMIPLETIEKTFFTDEEYAKMEALFQRQKNQARKVTLEDIEKL